MPALRFASLKAITRCNDCGQPLPLDAPIAAVECAACGARNALGDDTVTELVA